MNKTQEVLEARTMKFWRSGTAKCWRQENAEVLVDKNPEVLRSGVTQELQSLTIGRIAVSAITRTHRRIAPHFAAGSVFALPPGMTARCIDDLVAYQFAVEFKLEVYRVVNESVDAKKTFKYKDQLLDAASGIEACLAEGFARFLPGEFAQFIRYALGSLSEAETRLRDGVTRGYFSVETCAGALTWGRRCRSASLGLLASQRRRIERERRLKDIARKRRRS